MADELLAMNAATRRELEEVLKWWKRTGPPQTPPIPRRKSGASSGGAAVSGEFPVEVEVVCGLSGDQDTVCTYQYIVLDLAGNVLNARNETDAPMEIDCADSSDPPIPFVVAPGEPIPMGPECRDIECKKSAATTGTGAYDSSGTFRLLQVCEGNPVGVAPVKTCEE